MYLKIFYRDMHYPGRNREADQHRQERRDHDRLRDQRDRRHDNRRPRDDRYDRRRNDDRYDPYQAARNQKGYRERSPRRKNEKSAYDLASKKALEEDRKEAHLRQGDENEEENMMEMMGFSGGFSSTKGKKVACNKKETTYASKKTEERKYRQYMNRKGGFNRPLDYIS